MEATETSSSSGSATTGPTSFSEVSWSDAPSASTPSTDSQPAASASTDAIDPSAASASEHGQPQQSGEPPKERWSDILANARAKAAEEALAPYQWAKSIDQRELQSVMEMARKASTNPIEYLQDFIKELQSSPEHAAQLRSLAARALAQRQQATGPDLNPIPVQLENGQVVQLYSADQIAALKNQWIGEVEQKFQPVTKTIEQLNAERAAAQRQAEVQNYVSTTYEDVKTWIGMDQESNRRAVAEELARAPISSDDPREVSLALNAAYRKVVLPQLSQKAQAKLLDNLQQKAAASTSVNPGSAAPSSPRRIDSFHQLGKDAWT